jgi:carbon monoxide dehydrogenase subunit G
MPVVENSVTINVPVAKVFEFMDDPGNTYKWFAGVTDNVDITRTDEHVGDSWTTKYAVLGFNMDIEQTVAAWEENARVVINLGGMMPGSFTTTLSSNGDSTNVTQKFEYEVKGGAIGKMMNRIVLERMNAKNATRSLEDLKDLLEADAT